MLGCRKFHTVEVGLLKELSSVATFAIRLVSSPEYWSITDCNALLDTENC
jgi:hypothetical protein